MRIKKSGVIMKDKDTENEYIGIISIILIVILTVFGMYYYYSHTHVGPHTPGTTNVPIETPAPQK